MGRAPCCEKVGLKKGKWTAEEDEILIKYIKANGEGSWRSLPKKAGLLRCGKSCRLRWINYLRADLKRGSISAEEEEIIIKMHASFGNRWSLIAGNLPGRTDNEIKNYWNSHLSRRMATFIRCRESVPLVVDVGKLVGYQRKCGGNSKLGLKITSGNRKIRKEKEEKKSSAVVSYEESETMILGSHGEGESVVLDPFEVMESGALCISEEIESGNNKEIKSWMFDPYEETSEEMFRGGMENSEERESENMGLNEEREAGEKGVNEERGYSVINGPWVSPPAGSSCDERMNWDLGVLGVEGGELLSWLCDIESWEEELEEVPEHEQRSFADWLLSGDSDIL